MFGANGDFIESLAEISTALVIVGLTIEYVLPVLGHFRKPCYERPPTYKIAIHVLGPVLVTGGIAGELAFHHEANEFQKNVIAEQRRQIIALETRLAPRGIKPDERSRIVVELSEFKGTEGSACVPARGMMLPDVVPLAKDIQSILSDAKWNTPSTSGDCWSGYGILITGAPDAKCRAPAEAIAKALPAALGAHLELDKSLAADSACPDIIVNVGVPPPEGPP